MHIDLRKLRIHHWQDIKGLFKGADLFLGNGFSIMLNPKFSYTSLFEVFLSTLSAADTAIFKAFSTSNFEDILQRLQNAREVNRILGLPIEEIDRLIQRLKEGLISAVHAVHPVAADLDKKQLTEISVAFDHFGDILTTNYDALLYHIIMSSLDRHTADNSIRPYQDYFWDRAGGFLRFMGYQNFQHYKHIYYLHGALFIFQAPLATLKIQRTDASELIRQIEKLIISGEFPLFVSEGTTQAKQLQIYTNPYLQFARDHLSKARKQLVVVGSSLSAPDKHISDSIHQSGCAIAFGIHIDDKTEEDLITAIKTIEGLFPKRTVAFFDSSSIFPQ